MKTKKAIEIYLPPKTDSLNKEMLEKQSAITMILKGTPFEKDTNAIFEHLKRVQWAFHFSGEKERISIAEAKRNLALINTILVLFHSNTDIPKLKSDVIENSTDIPEEIIAAMKSAAKELYDKNLSLCHQGVVKYKRKDEIKEDGTIIVRSTNKPYFQDKEDKEYCEKVVVGVYSPITDLAHILNQKQRLEKIQGYAGNKTNKKEKPHIITDTFRMLCAIKVFCQCDGFEDWNYRGGKTDRNIRIFECLQVFGYATIRDTIDKDDEERQRQYIKERVRDAEKSNIVFVCPPL